MLACAGNNFGATVVDAIAGDLTVTVGASELPNLIVNPSLLTPACSVGRVMCLADGKPCGSLSVSIPQTRLQCTLPAGRGFALNVVVSRGAQQSAPQPLVSYQGMSGRFGLAHA